MRRSTSRHFSLFQKPLRLCFVVAFLLVMTLGIFSGMEMGMDGEMIGCPLMSDVAVICTMNVMEHLHMWNSMTTSVIPEMAQFMVFVILAFFVYRFPVLTSSGAHPPWSTTRIGILFHYLKQALSSGILHPKIFPVLA